MLYLALAVFGLVLALVFSRMLIVTGMLWFGLKGFRVAPRGAKKKAPPRPRKA
ncbi:MAG: hypothetical protein IT210_11570 [Armatimonadetes bacterium]|nr:hypothetical protein [Armatimonadota bacterium]